MKSVKNVVSLSAVLILASLFSTGCLAGNSIEDVIRKSFEVRPGGWLAIEADRGSVEIQAGERKTVDIQVIRTVNTSNQQEAKTRLQEYRLDFSQEGDRVIIHSETRSGGSWLWGDHGRGIQVRFVVQVPREFNVDLKTSGGSITVSDLAGEVRSETSGGSLHFGRTQGPVWGRTSGGSITLDGCSGKADVETSGGSIQIGEVEGEVRAETSGGSISIQKARAAVTASTSGGGITVEDVQGPISAETSGGSVSVTLTRQPQSDCRLTTSGGGIEAVLTAGVHVHVDAKTSGGRVHTDFPVTLQGEVSKTELDASINGGGPLLFLRTSGGSIHIRKLTAEK